MQAAVENKPDNKVNDKKNRAIIYGAVLIILFGAVLIFILVKLHNDHGNQLAQLQKQSEEESAYKSLDSSVSHDIYQNNYEVVSLGQAFLKQYAGYISKSQLYYVNSDISNAYTNLNDYSAALNYEVAVIKNSSSPSSNDYADLAGIYLKLNDKKDALKYFKLALMNLQNNPQAALDSDNEQTVITSQINNLESTN
jgi:tetratricopeptide (TPR) repeat protein